MTETMPKAMTDREFWASVPAVEDEPESPRQAATLAPIRDAKATRRLTLKAMGALGGALALNVLSWLPPFGVRPAAARVGHEWSNCAGYGGEGGNPDVWWGYAPGTPAAPCVGGPYGSQYCGSDGWFYQYSGTCFASGPIVVCGDGMSGGYYAKNAWRWTYSGTPYRCADGMQYWCGGQGFYICAKANPGTVVP